MMDTSTVQTPCSVPLETKMYIEQNTTQCFKTELVTDKT